MRKRKEEALHQALTGALVYVREAERELKAAQEEARSIGKDGKLKEELQAQADLIEQLGHGLENILTAVLVGVA